MAGMGGFTDEADGALAEAKSWFKQAMLEGHTAKDLVDQAALNRVQGDAEGGHVDSQGVGEPAPADLLDGGEIAPPSLNPVTSRLPLFAPGPWTVTTKEGELRAVAGIFPPRPV